MWNDEMLELWAKILIRRGEDAEIGRKNFCPDVPIFQFSNIPIER